MSYNFKMTGLAPLHYAINVESMILFMLYRRLEWYD